MKYPFLKSLIIFLKCKLASSFLNYLTFNMDKKKNCIVSKYFFLEKLITTLQNSLAHCMKYFSKNKNFHIIFFYLYH